MEKWIEQLERLTVELRLEDEHMASEVRKHGEAVKENFERSLSSIHRLHVFLFRFLDRLESLVADLKKQKGRNES